MTKQGILVFLAFFIITANAQIYKWTDSNGIVHFSDVPHSGAKEIILPNVQSTPSKASPPPASEEAAAEKPVLEYKNIGISQPKAEATIRNNQGFVPVIVETEPELMKGDLLQILFDGQEMGKPQNSKVFALDNVVRGSHTLAVQVMDKDGNILKTSETITIYMQRPRVGMVPGTRPRPSTP